MTKQAELINLTLRAKEIAYNAGKNGEPCIPSVYEKAISSPDASPVVLQIAYLFDEIVSQEYQKGCMCR